MNRMYLFACVAAVGFAAGAAQAASSRAAGAYAEPSQPIAYANLNTYLKASPKQRQARDWTQAGAATGAQVNTAAMAAPTDSNAASQATQPAQNPTTQAQPSADTGAQTAAPAPATGQPPATDSGQPAQPPTQ